MHFSKYKFYDNERKKMRTDLSCFRPLAGINYDTLNSKLITRLSSFRPLAGINYDPVAICVAETIIEFPSPRGDKL